MQPDTNDPGDADGLARLIRSAGRRAAPPAAAYEQTLNVAVNAWHRKVIRRQWAFGGAIAASVAVVAVAAWLALAGRQADGEPVAHVQRVMGRVEARQDEGDRWIALSSAAHLLKGNVSLRTAAGSRAALRLLSGISIRLDEGTELAFSSASRVELIAGRVYVDNESHLPRAIQIVTEAATATDIGTQFEVQYSDRQYRLRVREGRVLVESNAWERLSTAGDQLVITAPGDVRITDIEPDDVQWKWVESLAAAPHVDQQPLTVFLRWVSRETGRRIQYADGQTQRKAEATILHGHIDHLEPLQALSVMLGTTDLQHVVLDDGTIRIEARQPP